MTERTKDRERTVPVVEVRDFGGAEPDDHDDPYEDLTHERIFVLFSGSKRTGPWEPADQIEVSAIFGQVQLDFRNAVLPPSGIVEIRATAIFGSVEISVPDGADVEVKGQPVFGQFERRQLGPRARDRVREWVTGERAEDHDDDGDEPPLFRVTGVAVFGGVEVKGR